MRNYSKIKERLLEIEEQKSWSAEDRGEWYSLVWVLETTRKPPWRK